MRPIVLVVIIASFLGQAVAAERSPAADKYAACLIGTAAVEIRQYHDTSGGMDTAYKACAALGNAIDPSEADGVQEFAESVIASLTVSGAEPASTAAR
jgi:hypothetical protein